MYWKNSLILFLFLTWPFFGNAKDRALVVGGGCHNTLRKEMSKETLQINQSLKNRGWEMQNLFGDQTNSKDLKGFADATFSRENLIHYLEKNSKELKSGDKFFLNIITHGLPRNGNDHAICLGDGSKLSLNDPEIHKYLKGMKMNGVKMAFMDNSCYGGESIDLFDEYGCAMSTQVPQFPSYSTFHDEPKFRFGVSSILCELLDKEGSVSMEDLYLESLIQYGEDAQSGLLVFPQMSGDVVGSELAQWGAFYSMLNYGYIKDLDEYSLLDDAALSSEEKSTLEKNIIENVSCFEKEMGPHLEEFISDFDKVGKKLLFGIRHLKYKDQLDKNQKNTLLKNISTIHNLIQDMDKKIKLQDHLIASLNDANKSINDKINNLLKEDLVTFEFENKFTDDQINLLKSKGCLVGSDHKGLSCPSTANIHNLYYTEFNRSTFKGSYGVSLSDEVRDIILSKFEEQGVPFVAAYEVIDKKIDQVFWQNMDKTKLAQALDVNAKSKNELGDQKYQLELQKKNNVNQFKGLFNQMRGIDYLNRSKLFANKKIRNCRSFEF